MSEDMQIRCEMFKSDLVGAVSSYSVESVSLYPLLDILMLFYQEPIVISFFNKKKNLVFCTMNDYELCKEVGAEVARMSESDLIALPNTEYRVGFHRYELSKDGRLVIKPLERKKQGRFETIFSLLHKDKVMGGYVLRAFSKQLKDIEDKKTKKKIPTPKLDGMCVDKIEQGEMQALLDPMRNVLDEAFKLYAESPIISKIDGQALSYPNLFSVVQTKLSSDGSKRKNFFDYTARIFLSNTQRTQISKHLKGISCDDMEIPLGEKARSIADSVFSSGIIDFSIESPGAGRDNHDHGEGSRDARRQAAEARVYEALIANPKIFYVPVHISGVPWLLLFTLTPHSAAESWQQNYFFYVNLLPKIADRLRVSTKNAYLELASKIFAQEIMRADDTLIDRVNMSLVKLAMVYPFDLISLSADEKIKRTNEPFYFPHGIKAWVELRRNPYFTPQVEFDNLTLMECYKILYKEHIEIHWRIQAEALKEKEMASYSRSKIIGNSKVIKDILNLADRFAIQGTSSVLLLGERGVGKTILAEYIHKKSPRRDSPFSTVDCPSLPSNLLESELFGHIKGAFTGADTNKKGLLEAADGGTIFLDEIGDLDPSLQAKLLNVLETKIVRPVGATKNIPIDVRFIFATNRNLQEKMTNGQFRSDLYDRINILSMTLPPLRERRDDIPDLIKYYMATNAKYNLTIRNIETDAVETLRDWDWPGNIRQLSAVIEFIFATATSPSISKEDVLSAFKRKNHTKSEQKQVQDETYRDNDKIREIETSAKYVDAINTLKKIEEYIKTLGLDNCSAIGEQLSPESKSSRKDTALYNIFDRKDVIALFQEMPEDEAIIRWHNVIKLISSKLDKKKKNYPPYVQNYYSKC